MIPTFGRQEATLRAINSVVPAADWAAEIVVVDDGSPSPVLTPAHNAHGVPVRLFRQTTNSGAQAARNLGIRRAAFDHIAFLDSDDVFYPEKLTRVHGFLQHNPSDVLIHDATHMEPYRLVNRIAFGRDGPRLPFWFILALLNPVPTPALIIRRQNRLGAPSLRYCEDWAFLVRYCVPGVRVRYLPEKLSDVDRTGETERLSSAFWRMRRGELRMKSLHLRQPVGIAILVVPVSLLVWLARVVADLARGRYFRTADRAAEPDGRSGA